MFHSIFTVHLTDPVLSPISLPFFTEVFTMSQDSNMHALLWFQYKFSNNLSQVLYPKMQSTSPCCVHPLLSAGCPELFEGFVCHHWHTQPSVPPQFPCLGHNPCATFLFTHPSVAFTLIAPPVVVLPLFPFFLCLWLSCFTEPFC